MEAHETSRKPSVLLVLCGVILGAVGLVLAGGGAWLTALGGSWYYLLIGIMLITAAYKLARGQKAAFAIYGVALIATIIWSIWETNGFFWGLVPRLSPWIVMTIIMALLYPVVAGRSAWKASFAAIGASLAATVAGVAAMFVPHGVITPDSVPTRPALAEYKGESRWQYYGNTPEGTRHVGMTQITPENVSDLEVAWTVRTGDIAEKGAEFQGTPIQIEDTLYICTAKNNLLALDPETGEQKWRLDIDMEMNGRWNRCRGVAYYKSTVVPQGEMCHERIIMTSNDARMFAVDTKTGQYCSSFAMDGRINLEEGLGGNAKGEAIKGEYMVTSTPTVVNGVAIVGGYVADGRYVGETSGVVRAFSAETGELVWAWDMGNPNITKFPAPGERYTPATPNMWSTPSFDPELNLVYLPLGNSTPDFWGAHRDAESNKRSTGVVALNIDTGREAWHYQTVHYDIWDYDTAAQPALTTLKSQAGEDVPALVQAGKTGMIYVLDRRTGKPIRDIQELPVSQDGAEGKAISPTQPFTTDMARFGGDVLRESDMWGATFFDQLACRIAFRQIGYNGIYTPPKLNELTMIYPGYYGGMNWGSLSIDPIRKYAIVNDTRMPQIMKFIERDTITPTMAKEFAFDAAIHRQEGSPYAGLRGGFYSPLSIPCHSPPWGTVSAVDLETGKIVWQRPAGTIQDNYLNNGMKLPFSMPVGMPTLGGPLTTATGVTFHNGSQDYFLRAYATETGEELWKARLPVGGQSTPMSYISPESGDQFVVLAAGGNRQSPDRGDYLIAYRLKKN